MYGNVWTVGGQFGLKLKKNAFMCFQAEYIYGNEVKQEDVLRNIRTSEGGVIEFGGQLTNPIIDMEGFSLAVMGGYVFPVIGPNPNSGILVCAGPGFIQHRIVIDYRDAQIPQLEGEYLRGYDRLSNGFSMNEFIGYVHYGKRRLVNFYAGFSFVQSWTQNKRGYNYDDAEKDEQIRFGSLAGIRLGWMINLHRRARKNSITIDMRRLYSLIIALFGLAIYLVSAFNQKAGKWISGRKDWRDKLKKASEKFDRPIWIHCSSLGEFEQGRNVIEAIEKKGGSVVLTFFSPSGYEHVNKGDDQNWIFYLPLDTRSNAKDFIEILNPRAALFVKYEFWFNFIGELNSRQVPIYLISGIFRKDQYFFNWYGSWFRNQLRSFNHFFVQSSTSSDLLAEYGIENSSVSGDTRFDRVNDILNEGIQVENINSFTEGYKVVVAGSTWPEDEALIFDILKSDTFKGKVIIAPHEVDDNHLSEIEKSCPRKIVRYSNLNASDVSAEVLLIDQVGILSRLYKYGNLAYIGGGFGKGIHNTLEAAVYAIPLVFGPKFSKFREAIDLVNLGGAISISSENELAEAFKVSLSEDGDSMGRTCGKYVQEHVGATSRVMTKLEEDQII